MKWSCDRRFYSHVDLWRLEASLVDVVEGEGLSGVGAVFVYFHCRPVASLGLQLSLRLLPSGCHYLRQGKGHGTGTRSEKVEGSEVGGSVWLENCGQVVQVQTLAESQCAEEKLLLLPAAARHLSRTQQSCDEEGVIRMDSGKNKQKCEN